MRTLLCTVPDGSLKDTTKPLDLNDPLLLLWRPIGLLRLLDWMETKGLAADLYDINNLRPTDEELITNFKRLNPTVVGLSATLSHCYPNVKRISKLLRKTFPDVWIVVGGHITSSSNVILHKTEADICVLGDGEIPWVKLLNYFKLNNNHKQIDYNYLSQIKGLAFVDENNKLKVTGNAEQLPASELKYVNYDKIKASLQNKGDVIDKLFVPIKNDRPVELSKFYTKENINKKIAFIETSKGCVARCTFCQRATKGYKAYEVSDLEAHILELKKKYNVAGIHITDENFGSNKKQAYEIARILKKCDVFWQIGAARCTSVDYESLKFYKDHNCISIKFGIESGSQKILDIMEKKFTTTDVFNAISNCRKAGLLTWPDALMLGMPGETTETVKESSRFIASLRYELKEDWNIKKPFWAMAIPGTPLYEYCQQIGVIGKTLDEEEEYLIRTAEEKTSFLNYVNKTESDIKEVYFWNYLFEYEGKYAYLNLIMKNTKSIKDKISQIYEKCVKGEIHDFKENLYLMFKGKYFYGLQKGTFLQKTKWLTLIMANNLLPLGVLFLPRVVMYPIIRTYSNLRFYLLKSKYKVKNGKQKYNVFIEKNLNTTSNLIATENRVGKTKKQIERSLRSFAMANRKQIKPATTEEDKGLQILAEGQ